LARAARRRGQLVGYPLERAYRCRADLGISDDVNAVRAAAAPRRRTSSVRARTCRRRRNLLERARAGRPRRGASCCETSATPGGARATSPAPPSRPTRRSSWRRPAATNVRSGTRAWTAPRAGGSSATATTTSVRWQRRRCTSSRSWRTTRAFLARGAASRSSRGGRQFADAPRRPSGRRARAAPALG
jgi:hypothetical protein